MKIRIHDLGPVVREERCLARFSLVDKILSPMGTDSDGTLVKTVLIYSSEYRIGKDREKKILQIGATHPHISNWYTNW